MISGKGCNIAPSTISHHIKELRIAGLIHVAKKGRFTKCWVDAETVGRLTDLLNGRFALDGDIEECRCDAL